MRIFLLLSCLSIFLLADFKGLTPTQLQQKIDNKVIVIDIRTPQEWKQLGIIPTSKTIMFFNEQYKYNVEVWLSKLSLYVKDKKQPFILVCRSGNRTTQVGKFLSERLKYQNVFHLEHGIKSWIKEKRKVIK